MKRARTLSAIYGSHNSIERVQPAVACLASKGDPHNTRRTIWGSLLDFTPPNRSVPATLCPLVRISEMQQASRLRSLAGILRDLLWVRCRHKHLTCPCPWSTAGTCPPSKPAWIAPKRFRGQNDFLENHPNCAADLSAAIPSSPV